MAELSQLIMFKSCSESMSSSRTKSSCLLGECLPVEQRIKFIHTLLLNVAHALYTALALTDSYIALYCKTSNTFITVTAYPFLSVLQRLQLVHL